MSWRSKIFLRHVTIGLGMTTLLLKKVSAETINNDCECKWIAKCFKKAICFIRGMVCCHSTMSWQCHSTMNVPPQLGYTRAHFLRRYLFIASEGLTTNHRPQKWAKGAKKFICFKINKRAVCVFSGCTCLWQVQRPYQGLLMLRRIHFWSIKDKTGSWKQAL